MKKLKINMFLFVALGVLTMLNAQEQIKDQKSTSINSTNLTLKSNKPEDRIGTVVKVNSSKETINVSEKTAQKVTFDGIDYYVIEGIWHIKFKNRYVLRQAPKGARLRFIPKGGKIVTMGGRKYYKSNNVFYKKIKGGFYEVVRP